MIKRNRTLLLVNNLTYDYPGKRALNNVSFKIEPRTITALVGPNGAGKSTLLRCLAGLDLPLQGRINIDQIDVLNNPREAHALMGYLPDSYGLYEDLTVHQCLLYQAMAHSITKHLISNRIQETAEALEIQQHLNQEVGSLSRGQRQRVAIAQTLLHQPKLLLLDEPATNLDPEARHQLAQIFKNLAETGVTLLVSSHILAELEDYCTDMLVLREGKLMAQCNILSSTKAMMEVYLETQKEQV